MIKVKAPWPNTYVLKDDLDRVMAELKAFEKENPIETAAAE